MRCGTRDRDGALEITGERSRFMSASIDLAEMSNKELLTIQGLDTGFLHLAAMFQLSCVQPLLDLLVLKTRQCVSTS